MAALLGMQVTVAERHILIGALIISGKILKMNLLDSSGEMYQQTYSLHPVLLSVSASTSPVSMEMEKGEEAVLKRLLL